MTIQRWGVVVVVVLGVLAACSGQVPTTTCTSNSECGEGLLCKDGRCEANSMPECADGDTRPCGPEPVGACKKGVQRCVGGQYEATCTGQVRATDETCNSIDDDCDGRVDEDVVQTYYFDRDGDGHGAAADSVTACSAPTGTGTSSDDCDDTDPDVHPGATEVCTSAGVDEDCDGTIDEGCGCPTVGMTMACCSGRGMQTCEARDGGAMYSMCSVSPSAESCNGVDDDCDGQTDEALSYVTDAGFTLADGGSVASDGTCAAGVGACRRTATAACTMGAVSCAVTEGMPTTEVCNAVDDDCDGQTDEGTTVTCYADEDGDGVATGTAPSEQCPDTTRPTFGNCPTGFVATAPSAPDCEPMDATRYQVVSTRTDADGDSSCTGTAMNECIGATPPAGRQVASACTAGEDCDDASATRYRVVSTRADADSDTFCVGTAMDECIGASPNTGRRLATTCGSGDDCDDTNATVNSTRVACYPDVDNDGVATSFMPTSLCRDATRPTFGFCPVGTTGTEPTVVDCAPMDPSLYRPVPTRLDADNDGFCSSGVFNDCIGVSAPPGRRIATTCQPTDDCNDAAATLNSFKLVRTDNDGDNYCVNAAFNRCSETVLAPGFKLASACTQNDCNDNNSSQFRSVDLRTDADSDAWCIGATMNYCLGASNPAGMREVSACQGNDCKDNNPNATGTCSFTGYFTNEATKQCGIGPPPSEDVAVTATSVCPTGFSLINSTAGFTGGDMGGACNALNPSTIRMQCVNLTFGTFRCSISGTCVAN